jgi:hypothetical protein
MPILVRRDLRWAAIMPDVAARRTETDIGMAFD